MSTTWSSNADSFDREMEAWDIQFSSSSGEDDYCATKYGGAIGASGKWLHRDIIEIGWLNMRDY